MLIVTSLIGFLVAVLYVVPLALLNGFVLSILWSWFVVPFGLHTITVPHAIGLALIVGLMRPYRKPDDSKAEWGKIVESAAGMFLIPLMCLGAGSVVKGFM